MAKKYIDAEKLIASLNKTMQSYKSQMVDPRKYPIDHIDLMAFLAREYQAIIANVTSLQQEQPDKETILRICKLHKAWSIMAPWENIEDFVITNWNSKNII